MKRLLLVTAVLAVGACGSVHEGEIVRKFVEPPNDYVAIMPVYVGQTCYTGYKGAQSCYPHFIYVPFHMHDDEDYAIVLQRCEGAKCERGRRDLNREEYAKVRVGEWWSDKTQGRYVVEDEDQRVRRARTDELPKGTNV